MAEGKPKSKRSERSKQRENEYKEKTLRQFNFKLNRVKDADLIEAYENISDKRGFIREALRRYIEENNIKTGDE